MNSLCNACGVRMSRRRVARKKDRRNKVNKLSDRGARRSGDAALVPADPKLPPSDRRSSVYADFVSGVWKKTAMVPM